MCDSEQESSSGTVAGMHPFGIERWFGKYEFSAKHLLCCSDAQPIAMKKLIEMASPQSKGLWESLSLSYTESKGLPLLRKEVAAQLYSGPESSITEDNVLVLVPEEGIFCAVQAIVRPGDEVIVPDPCYQSLSEIAESKGCVVKRWKPHFSEDGSWIFRTDDLKSIVSDRTRLVVVNFPHNPTGALPSHAEWHEIVDICRSKNCYLFSDEMYRGLELDEADRLIPACELYDKAVTLSGVSKVVSCPGLRIGWLATQDRILLERVSRLKDYTTICASAPSEVLALIAVENWSTLAAQNRSIVLSGLEAAQAFFDKYPGKFLFKRPRATTCCYCKILDQPADKFCQDLVDKHGILLLPGSMAFGDETNSFFRLGLGRTDVPSIFDKLEEALLSFKSNEK